MKHCKGQLRTHTVHPKALQEHKNTENTHNAMQTHEIICKNVLQPVKAHTAVQKSINMKIKGKSKCKSHTQAKAKPKAEARAITTATAKGKQSKSKSKSKPKQTQKRKQGQKRGFGAQKHSSDAQAQRKHTIQNQNSSSGLNFNSCWCIFVHRRGGFQLPAQARWFSKLVEIHRACRLKHTATDIVNKLMVI